MASETVGFIGIGAMGRPMARCLDAAGFSLLVNDVDRATAGLNLGPGQDHTDLARRLERAAKAKLS